jgi:hypothetical protein
MLRSSWSSPRRLFHAGMLCTAIALAVAVPASAEGWLDEDVHGGKGYFMIGWGALDLSPLNDALGAGGYPTFTEDFLTLGGGGHALIGRFVLGGQGHAYISQEHDAAFTAGNYRTTVSAGTGFFDLGFVLWSHDSLLLTPLVGLGGGSVTLDIRELASPTFGDVLAQPGRRSTLATGGFLIDVGFSLDWIIDRGHGRGHGGPAVGVRAGWVISPIDGQWQLHEQDVAGGPELGVDGPYVRVMLGGGGIDN